MENNLTKLQADARRELGRELNEGEINSYLELQVMEASFENIDVEFAEECIPAVKPNS